MTAAGTGPASRAGPGGCRAAWRGPRKAWSLCDSRRMRLAAGWN